MIDIWNGKATAGSMNSGRHTDVGTQISLRAYLLYVARGADAGHDLEDWFRAEAEMMHPRIDTRAM
jgi:hypothetical protein